MESGLLIGDIQKRNSELLTGTESVLPFQLRSETRVIVFEPVISRERGSLTIEL